MPSGWVVLVGFSLILRALKEGHHYSDTVARFPGAIDTILRIVELVFGLSDNLCHQVDLRVNYTPELRGKYPESSQSILVGSL